MIDKDKILWDRGAECELCGSGDILELHHCLVHRMKGHEYLNDEENLEIVCVSCHPVANSYEHRRWFWARQVKRYGEEHMRNWYQDLPLKTKERFW